MGTEDRTGSAFRRDSECQKFQATRDHRARPLRPRADVSESFKDPPRHPGPVRNPSRPPPTPPRACGPRAAGARGSSDRRGRDWAVMGTRRGGLRKFCCGFSMYKRASRTMRQSGARAFENQASFRIEAKAPARHGTARQPGDKTGGVPRETNKFGAYDGRVLDPVRVPGRFADSRGRIRYDGR
ncbi:hypothetical protein NL676_017863 [Syzygium grande]|nr:hypothetical protein NL676_017863 [Syzygium grande]